MASSLCVRVACNAQYAGSVPKIGHHREDEVLAVARGPLPFGLGNGRRDISGRCDLTTVSE